MSAPMFFYDNEFNIHSLNTFLYKSTDQPHDDGDDVCESIS